MDWGRILSFSIFGRAKRMSGESPDRISRETRDRYGHPPKVDDFLSEPEGADDLPDTYLVPISEETEFYLGTSIFLELDARFSQIPGVRSVAWEDRAFFLVESGLDPETLRRRMWEKFLEAAEEAHRRYDRAEREE